MLAAVAALALAASGSASVVLAFDRTAAAPGATVEVFTGFGPDAAATAASLEGIVVYLVPVGLVEELNVTRPDGTWVRRDAPPTDDRLYRLGGLRHGADGAGRLSFQVPNLPPGEYTTGVWCPPCGNTFSTSYHPRFTPPGGGERLVLRIVRPVPEGTRDALVLLAVVLVAALGAGGFVVHRRWRAAAGLD